MLNDQKEQADESFDDKREKDMQQIRLLEQEKEALKGLILDGSQQKQKWNLEKADLEDELDTMKNVLPKLEQEIVKM